VAGKPYNPGVFDVSKPGKAAPSPYSKPIITGHTPMTADPTLRHEGSLIRPTSVPVQFDGEPAGHEESKVEVKNNNAAHVTPANDAFQFSEPETPANAPVSPPSDSGNQEVENAGLSAILATNKADDPVGLANTSHQDHDKKENSLGASAPSYSAVDSLMDEEKTHSDKKDHKEEYHQVNTVPDVPHIPQVTEAIKRPKKDRSKFKVALAGVLVLLIAGYLAADAGAFGSSVKMPFHIFKQKTEDVAPVVINKPTVTPSTPVVVKPTVPVGMTAFSDPATPLSFNYPTAWGTAIASKEDGTTSRSASPKADGTYAYKITFDTNKDIEVTATSNKYLPVRRSTAYYDYLQWCIGTNDSKFYQQTLRYTTASGTDTPTTVTCDQGPLDGAVKIDDSTIVQPAVKDSSGKTVIGDVYIKNLTDKELSAAHVKDATMKNGDDIKKMLTSLKVVIRS
jgi:hypothetical protein